MGRLPLARSGFVGSDPTDLISDEIRSDLFSRGWAPTAEGEDGGETDDGDWPLLEATTKTDEGLAADDLVCYDGREDQRFNKDQQRDGLEAD